VGVFFTRCLCWIPSVSLTIGTHPLYHHRFHLAGVFFESDPVSAFLPPHISSLILVIFSHSLPNLPQVLDLLRAGVSRCPEFRVFFGDHPVIHLASGRAAFSSFYFDFANCDISPRAMSYLTRIVPFSNFHRTDSPFALFF